MTDPALPLNQLLATHMPPGFIRALLEITPNLYLDAYDTVHNNPVLGKPEADYLLGHQRRALFEAATRNLGVEHGLKIEMEQPEKGGCKHVKIIVGPFGLTASHIAWPGGFPRISRSREQYASINEHLSQNQLFPVESNPRNKQIYGIIIHTEIPGKKNEFHSLSIGFPNHNFTAWVQEPTEFIEILEMQERLYRKPEDLQAQVQKSDPVWKKERKENKTLGEDKR